MDHDLAQLKRQMQAKQRQNFQLDPFVLETLDNFGYRYLPRKPSANAQKLDDHTYAIRSEETNPAQAMANISDPHISQKLQAVARPQITLRPLPRTLPHQLPRPSQRTRFHQLWRPPLSPDRGKDGLQKTKNQFLPPSGIAPQTPPVPGASLRTL